MALSYISTAEKVPKTAYYTHDWRAAWKLLPFQRHKQEVTFLFLAHSVNLVFHCTKKTNDSFFSVANSYQYGYVQMQAILRPRDDAPWGNCVRLSPI